MTVGRTSAGIVGAWVVGAALGRALTLARPDLEVTALEKESTAARLVQAGYAFHSALIRIARHRRLEGSYESLQQQQLLLCMSRNLIARERFYEDLDEHVQRHRHLLELVESGDVDAALAGLDVHGERSFEAATPGGNKAVEVTSQIGAKTQTKEVTRG